MPLTLTYTQGVFDEEEVVSIGKAITDSFLKWHNLTGNTVMTPNVTMHIQSFPQNRTLTGGVPFNGVWIETRTPSFALADRSIQEGFFADATDIIEEATKGKVARHHIFGSAIHTVDGTWNLNGRPMTNEELGAAIAQG